MRTRPVIVVVVVLVAVVLAWWATREAGTADSPDTLRAAPPQQGRQAQRLTGAARTDRGRSVDPDDDDARLARGAGLSDTLPPLDAGPLDSDSTTIGRLAVDGGADAALAVKAWLARNAAAAEKYVDAYCEKSRQLKRPPPNPPAGRARDASSFLTVRVGWEPRSGRPNGLLQLPEPLRAKLRAAGDDWPAAVRDDDLVGLDFSWMTRLHEFDHWNVMAEGPLRESRENDFYAAPIPNLIEPLLWTRLRFARAMRVGDFTAASADVHQLVALLRSSNILIADMMGVAILSAERVGLEAALKAGLAVPPGLFYEQDETARERQVGRSSMYFMYPGVSEAVMKKALNCNTEFRCSALAEGLGAHTIFGDAAHAETLALVSSSVASSGCNPELMDWIRKAKPQSPQELANSLDGTEQIERMLGPDGGR